MSRRTSAIAALALALVSSLALADDKAACIAASEAGQTARDAKKLEDARRSFVTCAGQACPKVIQTSCEQWLREVMELQPTVVFRAVDAKGNDLVDVKVLLDGKEVQASMTGKAIAVDPGPHKVTFQHAMMGTVEQSVVVSEGQKGRAVTAEWKPTSERVVPAPLPAVPATSAAAPAPAPLPLQTSPAEEPRSGRSPLPYVVGGVGVAALIASGVFFLSYSSKKSSLADNCPDGSCPPSQQSNIDGANTAGTISVITAAVGVVGLGVGTWMLLSDKAPKTTASAGVSPDGRPFAVMLHRF